MGVGLVRYELYRFKIRITTVTSIFWLLEELMDWFSVRILLALQNAVKRAMRAPRLRSAVLMFNLLYVHRYGMARKDLMRQLGGMEK